MHVHDLKTYVIADKSAGIGCGQTTETRAPFSVFFISFSCNFRGQLSSPGNIGTATASVTLVSTPSKLAVKNRTTTTH